MDYRQQIVDMMCAGDYTLDEIADMSGYSACYISRIFRKYMGITFREYRSLIRLYSTAWDILDTDDRIIDVALDHGYETHKAFTEVFRRRFGKTPSACRSGDLPEVHHEEKSSDNNIVELKNISAQDYEYVREYWPNDVPYSEIFRMIRESDNKCHEGRYYEVFGIWTTGCMVGMIIMYHYDDGAISIGIDIFNKYRRKGYGTQALKASFDKAKDAGYKLAVAPINIRNIPSMKLHEKCGFALAGKRINRHGNKHLVFVKSL